MDNSELLIREYLNCSHIYEKYSEQLAGLLKLLLFNAGIKYQHITYRAKGEKELRNKIVRKSKIGRRYENLNDITDLAGVRIIVYFKDDIKRVVEILEREFYIHKNHTRSLEEEIAKNPREFKYKSDHRIVSLKKTNENLFKGIEDGSFFYFCHSYYAPLTSFTVGTTLYGVEFSSIIVKENIVLVQFHPENSALYNDDIKYQFTISDTVKYSYSEKLNDGLSDKFNRDIWKYLR